MFYKATSFNQPLNSWNVSNVTKTNSMFDGASAFNQNLSSWDVSNVENASLMFADVILSTTNYDALLIGWSALTLTSNVVFSGGGSMYCNASSQRASIISIFNWTITDGGYGCARPAGKK
jgi:surface protein